jgi:L-threonylcarbamoyladenylate synthase
MIQKAANHLKRGDIVIFPTDTVYGIGCAISKQQSISRLYQIRQDETTKPQLILTASASQAFEYGSFDKHSTKLARIFWPGPLTIVVKAREKVPKAIRGRGDTIAIRVPNQPPLLEIIKLVGEPILAPSANFHSEKTPTSFAEIDKRLISLVDYAIDLKKLPKALKMQQVPSTIVDLTKSPYQVIRAGAVNLDRLKRALEEPSQ